jgi:predicted Zn finger-like uncharacterized protein
MLITCPKCTTSYEVDSSSLSPAGGSVRCARCEHSWFAANTAAIAAIEQAYRSEIAEFSCTLASPSTGTELVPVIKPPAAAHTRAETVEIGNSGEKVSINRILPRKPLRVRQSVTTPFLPSRLELPHQPALRLAIAARARRNRLFERGKTSLVPPCMGSALLTGMATGGRSAREPSSPR